mmetsp:Transcript_8266/g.31079  ORF Transcript_8266/g.31079 Transcript_8266/m.31079 type:complete len:546 (-) Transcript_8266:902-2539(-)
MIEREFPQVLVAVRRREVPGFQIHFQQNLGVAQVVVPEMLDPLGWLPVRHARIVQARRREDVRIVLRHHVVHGAVHPHVVVVLRIVWVAPFLPFAHRQRDRGVAHGHHEVDERNPRDRGLEEIRAHVEHRAHQEASRAAALHAHHVARGELQVHEVLCRGDEVEERVHLRQVLAHRLIPGAAHLAAAANVRDGVRNAAIKERKARCREGRIHAGAVAAVSVEMQRHGLPLFILVLAVHDGHRNLLAIVRGRLKHLGRIQRRVVVGHLFLLDQLQLARLGRVVEGRAGRHHARVAHPDLVGVELRVRPDVRSRGRVGELHLVALARKPRAAGAVALCAVFHLDHPNAAVAVVSAGDGDEVLEARQRSEHAGSGAHICSVPEDRIAFGVQKRLPVLRPRRSRGCHGELEILVVLVVGDDVEVSVPVIHIVEHAKAPRRDDGELALLLVEVQHVNFRRLLRRRLKNQEVVIERLPDAHPEEIVLFRVQQLIFTGRGAHRVPPELVRPVLVIHLRVENRALVLAPLHPRVHLRNDFIDLLGIRSERLEL